MIATVHHSFASALYCLSATLRVNVVLLRALLFSPVLRGEPTGTPSTPEELLAAGLESVQLAPRAAVGALSVAMGVVQKPEGLKTDLEEAAQELSLLAQVVRLSVTCHLATSSHIEVLNLLCVRDVVPLSW